MPYYKKPRAAAKKRSSTSTSKSKKTYRSARTARPARFPSGKKTYEKSRSVSNLIKSISETKVKALTPANLVVPQAVEVAPTLGPCYFTNFCLGNAPAAWTGPSGGASFTDLGGFEWPLGPGAAERNGQYMYLKRTRMNLRLAMNAQSRVGAVKFRVVVYKEKRNRYNTAGNGNPNNDLFLDQSGNVVGVNTVATVNQRAIDFNTWLVNKRNYQVVHDSMCILAPETLSYQGGVDPRNISQSYPSEKMFNFNLGHYQKAKFGQDNLPEDQMYRYCMTIISMPMTSSVAPHDSFRTYVNGLVSTLDN